jgi:hypothetical protein
VNEELIFGGLIVLGVGWVVYQIGKDNGCKKGYRQAKTEDQQWIQSVSGDNIALQSENAKLAQENGSLCKENEIVTNLLQQQPTTPQAEAILKSLQRVELRLTEALPSALDDGEDHDFLMN